MKPRQGRTTVMENRPLVTGVRSCILEEGLDFRVVQGNFLG